MTTLTHLLAILFGAFLVACQSGSECLDDGDCAPAERCVRGACTSPGVTDAEDTRDAAEDLEGGETEGAGPDQSEGDDPLRWFHSAGGANPTDIFRAVEVDLDGNVTLVGELSSTTHDFGCGPVTAGTRDIVALKLDPDGQCVWSAVFQNPADAFATDLTLAPDGDVLLTGWFEERISFGTGELVALGPGALFVVRLAAADGSQVWARAYGGAGARVYGNAIHLYQDDELFVAGHFTGDVDFGDGETRSSQDGDGDVFVARLREGPDLEWTERGEVHWVTTYGSPQQDVALDVLWSEGHAVVTGSYRGVLVVDDEVLEHGEGDDEDIFLVGHHRGDGHAIWARGFGSDEEDVGRRLANWNQQLVLCAEFESEMWVDQVKLNVTNSQRDLALIFIEITHTPTGVAQHALQLGGSGEDRCAGLSTFGAGLLVAGSIDQPTYLGEHFFAPNTRDAVMFELAPNLEVRWAWSAGDVGADALTAVVGHGEEVVLTGVSEGPTFAGQSVSGGDDQQALVLRWRPLPSP